MWACVYIYIYTYMDVFIYLYRYFFYSLFLIKGLLHYGIVLMSAIHQQESAIVIHMSPASWTSLPPVTPFYLSRLSQSTSLSSLSHTANSSWLFYIWQWMCFHATLSIHPILSILHTMHISLVCRVSVSSLQSLDCLWLKVVHRPKWHTLRRLVPNTFSSIFENSPTSPQPRSWGRSLCLIEWVS